MVFLITFTAIAFIWIIQSDANRWGKGFLAVLGSVPLIGYVRFVIMAGFAVGVTFVASYIFGFNEQLTDVWSNGGGWNPLSMQLISDDHPISKFIDSFKSGYNNTRHG